MDARIVPAGGPVVECQRIIDNALAEARRRYHASPLIEVGLVEILQDAVAAQPKPSWDEKTGVVTIAEPTR